MSLLLRGCHIIMWHTACSNTCTIYFVLISLIFFLSCIFHVGHLPPDLLVLLGENMMLGFLNDHVLQFKWFVLGKVLQDSQESNAKLKQEIEQLRSDLIQKGVDEAQAGFSVFTVSDDDCQSVIPNQDSSCLSSMAKSTSGIHDYVNITTVSGRQSLSASFLSGESHMKVNDMLYFRNSEWLLICKGLLMDLFGNLVVILNCTAVWGIQGAKAVSDKKVLYEILWIPW